MHNQFANAFYGSEAWKKTRRAFKNYKRGLCERCLARGLIVPGTEVHHKVHLTPENLDNPRITLSWSNLELLCKACHDEEHAQETRLRTDADGHVTIPDD